MILDDKDLELIRSAEKAQSRERAMSIVVTMVLVTALAAFFSGQLNAEAMAGLSVVLVFVAIFSPLIAGPPYAKLVSLLVKVRENSERKPKDPIVEAFRDDR